MISSLQFSLGVFNALIFPLSSHQPTKTMYEKEVEQLIEKFEEIDRIETSDLLKRDM